jgi:hypothetical protein
MNPEAKLDVIALPLRRFKESNKSKEVGLP